uniref:Uncharacterized protein n=1 Tax=Pipistrellus kuhlii TaxID=59472 RepID=A0A7J7YWT3_PIPKU|nr:hypothetical protein mPipKuh1_009895 [Pipistrellus kuhlii]
MVSSIVRPSPILAWCRDVECDGVTIFGDTQDIVLLCDAVWENGRNSSWETTPRFPTTCLSEKKNDAEDEDSAYCNSAFAAFDYSASDVIAFHVIASSEKPNIHSLTDMAKETALRILPKAHTVLPPLRELSYSQMFSHLRQRSVCLLHPPPLLALPTQCPPPG